MCDDGFPGSRKRPTIDTSMHSVLLLLCALAAHAHAWLPAQRPLARHFPLRLSATAADDSSPAATLATVASPAAATSSASPPAAAAAAADEVAADAVSAPPPDETDPSVTTLELLEWPRLSAQVASLAGTRAAKEALAGGLPVDHSRETAEMLHREMEEAYSVEHVLARPIDLRGFSDIAPLVTHARKGGELDGESLVAIGESLQAASALLKTLKGGDAADGARPSLLAGLFEGVPEQAALRRARTPVSHLGRPAFLSCRPEWTLWRQENSAFGFHGFHGEAAKAECAGRASGWGVGPAGHGLGDAGQGEQRPAGQAAAWWRRAGDDGAEEDAGADLGRTV